MAFKSLPQNPDFQKDLQKEALRKHCGKRKNAGNQHFLLFPQHFLPFPKQNSIFQTISNLTKNGSKLSKRVETIVGKGEIARYEQFLLSPQCFQKACFPGVSKGVTVREWFKLVDWERDKINVTSYLLNIMV